MKRFYTLLAVCLLLANTVEAQIPAESPVQIPVQKRALHEEYLIYVSAGMSNLRYSLANGGETQGGTGFGAGLDYVCNVSSTFGFSMGAELSSYQGKALYRSLTETYSAIDDQGTAMEYTYSIDNYTEKQNLMLLSLPIMVRFKVPAGQHSSFYFAGGVKFGFPIMSRMKISGENLTATGYYPYENLTYSNVPEHGFFSGVNVRNEESSVKGMTTMTTLSVETGLRFVFGKHLLYTGLYCDYSLNGTNSTKGKHPVNYVRDITYESVMNSSLSSKLNLTSMGVKVRFSLF